MATTTLETTKGKTNTAALALPEDLRGSWGSEGVDNSDILIPRLLLMQGLSDAVAEGTAKIGDIIKSTTGEVLATKDKPLAFIPVLTHKTWAIYEKVNGKAEFKGMEPMTAANATAPLEWTQNGTTWRRDRCIDFFVLLPADIERERKALDKLKSGDLPEASDALFPCHLSFRRTSYDAGKVLATHFSTANRFNLPPAASTFNLSASLEKNDKGTFAVFNVKAAGKTSNEDLAVARKWYTVLSEARANERVAVDNTNLS